jgi:uncharacterized protein (TIGR03435 family)
MNANLVGTVFIMTAMVSASQPIPQLAFDVASIKPSRIARAGGEGSGRERVTVTPDSVTIENGSLSFCIQWAYNVRFYQVSGPDRLVSQRYDIIAKTEKPSSRQQLMTMMQTLLSDRFSLRLHRETRTVPVYELVGRSGNSNLRLASADSDTGMTVENGSFVFRRVTMAEFATRLSDFSAFDRPVLDRTGIDGFFDITLTSAAIAMRADPDAIFAAVESTGLRLNPGKAPLEMIVVDHAEGPTPN